MTNGTEEILINSIASASSATFSSLSNFLPRYRWISATGNLSGGKIVCGVYLQTTDILVKYFVIDGFEGGVDVRVEQNTYSSSYFNVSTQIKVF